MAQVKQADAIAVDKGSTALLISHMAWGINIPWEKPQKTAPIISIKIFDGNKININVPKAKLSIATGSVYFFIILVINLRVNPMTT